MQLNSNYNREGGMTTVSRRGSQVALTIIFVLFGFMLATVPECGHLHLQMFLPAAEEPSMLPILLKKKGTVYGRSEDAKGSDSSDGAGPG